VTALTYTYVGTVSGTTYIIKIAARNEIGLGDFCAPVNIIAAIVPSAPINLARVGASTDETQVTL